LIAKQDMSGKQAKTISEDNIKDLLIYAECTRHPVRNQIIVLLSAKAGLRAGEIAKLTWDMLLDANGGMGRTIELRDHAAKNRSGRQIPIHSQLRDALSVWRGMNGWHRPGFIGPPRSDRTTAGTDMAIGTAIVLGTPVVS
jgi:integrase